MENYTYTFTSSKTQDEVFRTLLNVELWWMGLFNETIIGTSNKVNDEFSFDAGAGAHFSRQKLIELVPNKKLVWLVTESKLSFLSKVDEWTNTKISFEISLIDGKTKVGFTHIGLVPEIECCNACSSGWTGYLENLKKKLN